MVKIRLSRGGSKKRPFFWIVAADERCPRDGKNLERLGFFNPLVPKGTEEPKRIELNMERLNHWVQHGAQTTMRVNSLIKEVKKKVS